MLLCSVIAGRGYWQPHTIALLTLLSFSSSWAQESSPAPAAQKQSLEQLVNQLADTSFSKRQQAQETLLKLGPTIQAALQKGLRGDMVSWLERGLKRAPSRRHSAMQELDLVVMLHAQPDDSDRETTFSTAMVLASCLGKPVLVTTYSEREMGTLKRDIAKAARANSDCVLEHLGGSIGLEHRTEPGYEAGTWMFFEDLRAPLFPGSPGAGQKGCGGPNHFCALWTPLAK